VWADIQWDRAVSARAVFSIIVIQAGKWRHICAELLQQHTHLFAVPYMAWKRDGKPDYGPQNQ
jgi:hypothetical protein